jgi:hypothetical protein
MIAARLYVTILRVYKSLKKGVFNKILTTMYNCAGILSVLTTCKSKIKFAGGFVVVIPILSDRRKISQAFPTILQKN